MAPQEVLAALAPHVRAHAHALRAQSAEVVKVRCCVRGVQGGFWGHCTSAQAVALC